MLSRTLEWGRGLWRFYLAYTQTATHAATAAAFAIFGLLVFVDSLFAIVAISAYVVPPVVLYVLEDEPPSKQDRRAGREPERRDQRHGEQRQPQERPGQDRTVAGRERTGKQPIGTSSGDAPSQESERGSRVGWTEDASSAFRDGNGDTDSDSDDGDTDTDSDDGDTDSDSDDGDMDSDSDDGDTDSDSDDGDTDSDSDDGDTDSDSDDGDTDSDS